MKRLITLSVALFGVCAVVVVSPSSGSAAPDDKSIKSDTKVVVQQGKTPQDRTYYVHSTECATGSFIPSVYRVYHGVVTSTSSSSGRAYTDLGPAGSDNVGTSLARLDPSITVNGHR